MLPVAEFRRLERLFPEAEFEDVGRDIVRQRAVKSAWEVERIRAAAAIAVEVCELIPGILREGLTEAEFAGLVEAQARRLGHEGIIRMRGFNQEMFYGQLLTGVSGTAASYLDTPLAGTGLSPAVAQGVSFRTIRRGDHVVFDFVPVREGYIADFTRIFTLGELPGELRRAYEAALRIQAAVVAAARPGVTCRALYDLAVAAAADEGLAAFFMGHGAGQVRFIGHGVGLELDELPVLTSQRPGARRGHGLRSRAQVRAARPGGHRRREHVAGHRFGPRAHHGRPRAHPPGRLRAAAAGKTMIGGHASPATIGRRRRGAAHRRTSGSTRIDAEGFPTVAARGPHADPGVRRRHAHASAGHGSPCSSSLPSAPASAASWS